MNCEDNEEKINEVMVQLTGEGLSSTSNSLKDSESSKREHSPAAENISRNKQNKISKKSDKPIRS